MDHVRQQMNARVIWYVNLERVDVLQLIIIGQMKHAPYEKSKMKYVGLQTNVRNL